MLQFYKLGTGGFCLGGFIINLLLKLRKVICGSITGSGSFEIFDGSPVLQSWAVLELFSGGIYERSARTGASSASTQITSTSVLNGQTRPATFTTEK